MKAQEMWEAYTDEPANYEAWAYGSAVDELADLTLKGIKTATASAYDMYEAEEEQLPQVGTYHIILNSQEDAVCIIRITEVEVVPFSEVTPEHAFLEGEGERTLEEWRQIHQTFFTQELKSILHDFHEDMLVVCERFEMVYPK